MKCYCVVLLIMWPRPLTLKLVCIIARGWVTFPPILVFLDVSLSTYQPTPVRSVTWPCDLDLWPWRSRRLSSIRVFVLRLCTKFEIRSLVGLPVPKLWRTSSLSIWLLTLKLVRIIARAWVNNLPTNFGVLGRFVLDLCQTDQAD